MERPPVTIAAPARPGAEPDLLVGGEDEAYEVGLAVRTSTRACTP